MEVYMSNSKVAMLLLMMMMTPLLNAYCCGAAVVAKSNTSFGCNSGRLDECLLIEEYDLDLELGFLINPYVSRILAGHPLSPNYGNHNEPALPCGKPGDPRPYHVCSIILNQNFHECQRRNAYGRCNPINQDDHRCPPKSIYDRCKPDPKFESWN